MSNVVRTTPTPGAVGQVLLFAADPAERQAFRNALRQGGFSVDLALQEAEAERLRQFEQTVAITASAFIQLPPERVDTEIEKALEQAREAMRQAGQDSGLIDEIMNGADPAVIMAGIMVSLGLDPEQGAAALEGAQAKNAAMMKEQGMSDEDIAMLFGNSNE